MTRHRVHANWPVGRRIKFAFLYLFVAFTSSFSLVQPATAAAAPAAPAPVVFAAASADSPGRFGLELTFTNEKLIEMARDENGDEYRVCNSAIALLSFRHLVGNSNHYSPCPFVLMYLPSDL